MSANANECAKPAQMQTNANKRKIKEVHPPFAHPLSYGSPIPIRKIPAPIRIKLALPPLPKKPKSPPLLKTRNFMGMERFSCRKNQNIPGAHTFKLAQPFPALGLRRKVLRTRLFLTQGLAGWEGATGSGLLHAGSSECRVQAWRATQRRFGSSES